MKPPSNPRTRPCFQNAPQAGCILELCESSLQWGYCIERGARGRLQSGRSSGCGSGGSGSGFLWSIELYGETGRRRTMGGKHGARDGMQQ